MVGIDFAFVVAIGGILASIGPSHIALLQATCQVARQLRVEIRADIHQIAALPTTPLFIPTVEGARTVARVKDGTTRVKLAVVADENVALRAGRTNGVIASG